MPLTLDFVLAATGGRLVGPKPVAPFTAVTTDSRAVAAGSLFVALAGERFDGHTFVPAARAAGAAAALVWAPAAESLALGLPGFPLVAVADPLTALGDLAAARRRRAEDLKVLAVTGSNGKTTTKEMLAAAVAPLGPMLKTEGNLNNLIGLPRTLLAMAEGTRVAVLEMGMNRFGEIARLTEIARPDIGVITNVGPVHLERLGTLDGVRRAKLELFRGMPAGGTAVVNADDPNLRDGTAGLAVTPLRVALDGTPDGALARGLSVDVIARAGRTTPEGRTPLTLETPAGRVEVNLPAEGRHQAMNAALAAAAALAAGVALPEVAAGLERFTPVPGRFERVRLEGDVVVVNDAYNANPASMAASLEVFCAAPIGPGGRRLAALGEMRELGDASAAAHRDLGRRVAALPLDGVYVYGPSAELVVAGAREAGAPDGRVVALETHEAIAEAIAARLVPGSAVFVKGSRGVTMERVIAALERRRPRIDTMPAGRPGARS
ncbi:MAG TPA: UDP-N-acetylmuramoyl-tripeptide--D-alanyl-D-alanine ligase [Thermodesulfobacteriota bacterium]